MLAAPEALAAVQALVTGAVADGDMAAARACWRVLLKVGYGIAEAFNFAMPVAIPGPRAVSVAVACLHIDDLSVF